ncbi:beta-propeller fold lactonase family protein [Actinoplanes sp. LDG1-06]|uniref:Beta-propeller fold lactonase family protein n=1 Tax=Paractinoplanes ovalisporus TaxID=2810368 RepID=A0ABS2A9R4_9ACTN|nr:beta-propeller fold lactonase family protein [Actinoplanes ovalisporus]MBM2616573.1 beta-propeller fold lactonase family protein [Actinoplanes ovalisporus]
MTSDNLPPELAARAGDADRNVRHAAVGELLDLARGDDREAAVAARAALVELTSDDSRQVSAAAEEALASTSIALEPPRIDFGPVAPGTPRLEAVVTITGSPMALASRLKVTGGGLRARIAGDQLQVQWLPGGGPLTGMVSLDGPAGAADLPVTGHIGFGPLTGFAAEARQNAVAGLGSLQSAFPPVRETELSKKSGKGLIVAAATAVVLLAGTGIAAAVTLTGNETAAPPAVQQEPTTTPPTAPPSPEAPAPRRESIDKPTVEGTIKVGDEPEGVAVSPDSRTLYVANQNSRILSVVDLTSGDVKSVQLRNTPRFVAVSRDGRRVFVSMYEDLLDGSGVAVVDAEKLTVLKNLNTGVQPYALAVAPDGRLWVPIHGGRNVEIYSAAEQKLEGRVFVPENPHAVSFDTDGRRAFTPDHESSTVSVIDMRNDQRLRSIPVSAAPHSLAVSPDGRTVVVACFQANAVDIIDAVTLERRGPFKVGTKPQAAAFATDSGHAYAVNEGSNSVSVVDPRTGRITATVPVGRSPRTMAVSPDGKFAYVSNGDDDTVTILRVS